MKSMQFKTSLVILIGALSGCNLENINQYGNNCAEWAYVLNGNNISCNSETLEDCNEAFQVARKAGKCPERFEMCTFDAEGRKFCMANCSSASAPNLCNGECLNDAAYALARKDSERDEKGEAVFCTPCPIECHESCDPETLECPKIECPDECVNGCDENGACRCFEECAHGCNKDGSCKCSLSCPNGCDATGTTCCSENCQNGCNLSDICLCPKGCANGCDTSGKACCDDKCKNGCEVDGSCFCPGNCVNKCDEDGSCKPSEGCQNNIDENGACKCPRDCVNGCDKTGTTCSCPENCESGCDKSGSKCTCEANCVDGSSCDTSRGRCTCIDKCKFGCDETGSCDEACESVECKGTNEQCQKGECVDLCKDITCPDIKYCKMGKCVPIDGNQNHMHDQYESAPTQGKSCRKYADCDSSDGAGDGFCDSFIGYKCSTKCTSDEQCIDDGTYQYICRPDGRCAPDSFVTVWMIPDDSPTLSIPTYFATKCDFIIDWGDGSYNTITACPEEYITHKYDTSGKYTVTIKGKFDGFGWKLITDENQKKVDITPDRSTEKLREVKAFGIIGLGKYAFAKCSNLEKFSSVDIPDATKLKLIYAFSFNREFNLPIEHWDISKLNSLESVFNNARGFDHPLNHWDTSNVTNMKSVFTSAIKFNQSLDQWDTSNVTNMTSTFWNAQKFNQPIDKWNVSNVTTMENMFREATSFNHPLENWDTSNVTNMSYMFDGASNFDQAIENWNTSKVENMTNMFTNASHFNHPLNKWDTSNVGAMTDMFFEATAFNQPLDNWNISKVVSIGSMFYNAKSFNQDINTWNTSSVENMSFLFFGASKFNNPLDSWNISKVKDTSYMFSGAEAFNQKINKWDTSNVTNMSNMFSNTAFNQSIEDWDTSNVTNMKAMFYSATQFNQPLDKWDTSKVTNMSNMFYNAKAFNQDLSNWVVNATVSSMFDGSALSQDNYCKIRNSATWTKKPTMSQYTCDAQQTTINNLRAAQIPKTTCRMRQRRIRQTHCPYPVRRKEKVKRSLILAFSFSKLQGGVFVFQHTQGV